MARLRGPEGCPWDRAQGYDSVKGLLLEEAYEVVDAVDARDFAALQDELGDLLFQVVFYSRLAEEEERFSMDDVIERAHAKLVRRHPHVFGETRARTPEAALESWLSVKEKERAESGGIAPAEKAEAQPPFSSHLDGMARTLPSTLEAYELSARAAKAGFDWANLEDLLDKIEEEVRELRHEIQGGSGGLPPQGRKVQVEVGDLLFAAANLARHVRSDPETCLRLANQKFQRRFRALEQEVAKRGKRVRNCNLAELDAIWNAVKAAEQ